MMLTPGSTIGILGGGQLGRMTAIAAAQMGYHCHVFCPDADPPAAEVARATTRASYDDAGALAAFAASVDVVTYEFENVDLAAVDTLVERVPVRPGAKSLAVSQDRVAEKSFMREIGVATTHWAEIRSDTDLVNALEKMNGTGILKTTRMGYDGKGQVRIGPETDPDAAWRALDAPIGILEALVDFACEISVVLARGEDGTFAAYVPVENQHEDGILRTTRAPARIAPAVAAAADDIARRIAEGLGLVGVLAVEMFVTREAAVLVNEIAPRPHNSGHWTIDACPTSQFELLVRAVCGLPLIGTDRHSDAVMTNILGHEVEGWRTPVGDPAARLHLYGKGEARPGRKMGHVTRLAPRSTQKDSGT